MEYVFNRLYGDDPTSRFLIADEVGLGKTLVARGIIAKTLEHLQDEVERVDVIYICSNAAIATQNVNRLNVSDTEGFSIATRLTYLPRQVRSLRKNKVNFISLTLALHSIMPEVEGGMPTNGQYFIGCCMTCPWRRVCDGDDCAAACLMFFRRHRV